MKVQHLPRTTYLFVYVQFCWFCLCKQSLCNRGEIEDQKSFNKNTRIEKKLVLNRKNKIIEENIFLHANIQLIVIDTIENRKCDCNRKMSSFTAYEKNTSRSGERKDSTNSSTNLLREKFRENNIFRLFSVVFAKKVIYTYMEKTNDTEYNVIQFFEGVNRLSKCKKIHLYIF